MESLGYLLVMGLVFVVLAAGSLVWGVDSRPGMADDHAR